MELSIKSTPFLGAPVALAAPIKITLPPFNSTVGAGAKAPKQPRLFTRVRGPRSATRGAMSAIRRQKDLATRLLQQGKWPAALAGFREVLEAVPADQTARQKVAEILAHQGQHKEAVAVYAEAVRRYSEEGQFFKAVALSRVILGLEPGHALALQLLAELSATRHTERPVPPPPPVQPVTSTPVVRVRVEHEVPRQELQPVSVPPAPALAPSASAPVIPLFAGLGAAEFVAVLEGLVEPKTWPPLKAIVTEGEPGGSMFAVMEGVVSVWRKGQRVAQLEAGAFFGEMALLSGSTRMATVVAETPAVILEFTQEKMDRVIAQHPSVRQGLEQFFRERLTHNLLRTHPLLQPLTDEERRVLSAAFQPCGFAANQVIVDEGCALEAVFLLLRGQCTSFQRAAGARPVPDCVEGDFLGDLAVLTGQPSLATVRARVPVLALRVPAQTFRSIVLANPEVSRRLRQLGGERLSRAEALALIAATDERL